MCHVVRYEKRVIHGQEVEIPVFSSTNERERLQDNTSPEYRSEMARRAAPNVQWERTGQSMQVNSMGYDCPRCHRVLDIINTPEGQYRACQHCSWRERISERL